MKLYHVHVYGVVNMAEVNVEAKSKKDTRQKALDKVKTATNALFRVPDCRNIAICGKRAKCNKEV